MPRFRSLARFIALLLLFVGASDLLGVGDCEDSTLIVSSAVLGENDGSTDVGHRAEDCYCCSRTVHVQAAHELALMIQVVGEGDDLARFLPQSPARLLYHPPLA